LTLGRVGWKRSETRVGDERCNHPPRKA
jgi:hypothetical protein